MVRLRLDLRRQQSCRRLCLRIFRSYLHRLRHWLSSFVVASSSCRFAQRRMRLPGREHLTANIAKVVRLISQTPITIRAIRDFDNTDVNRSEANKFFRAAPPKALFSFLTNAEITWETSNGIGFNQGTWNHFVGLRRNKVGQRPAKGV